MPHLTIECSPEITASAIEDLCTRLLTTIASRRKKHGEHEYPPDGTFVRAYRSDFAVVGGSSDAAFVHAVLKIGPGRTDAIKRSTGDELIDAMRIWAAAGVSSVRLQLSLEIHELPGELSWRR